MNYALLNLGSLLLGIAALALPVAAMSRDRGPVHAHLLSLCSALSCALSLFLQLLYVRHKICIGDYSALLDTFGAVIAASAALLICVTVLNVLSYLISKIRLVK